MAWKINPFTRKHDYYGSSSSVETDPVVGAISGIVKADGAGNISAAVSGTDYAPASEGVTNGDSHDHSGGDGAAIPDAALSSGATVVSAGAGDSGKLVKLDVAGHVDATAINDADISLDSVTEGVTNKFYTSTEKTKLSGIEAAADVTDATNVDAAGAVMESDYNAQTILAATSDNTPAALTIGEQTVVGRITSGNIAALTVAQLQALLFSAALPENTSITLDAALSADGKYSGIVEDGTAGAALAFGDLCYLAAADSRWELADASAASTAGDVKIGICVLAAVGDGSATTMLLFGKVRADTAFPSMTISAPQYISETAGDITGTQPTTTDAVIRRIGFANTADELFFCPSPDYITHT